MGGIKSREKKHRKRHWKRSHERLWLKTRRLLGDWLHALIGNFAFKLGSWVGLVAGKFAVLRDSVAPQGC